VDAREQPHREQRQGRQADRVHRDVPASLVRDPVEAEELVGRGGVAGGEVGRAADPVGDVRRPPRPVGDQDRVLHHRVPVTDLLVVAVGPGELGEPSAGVEVGQVGVAHVRVALLAVAPGVLVARRLLHQPQREADRGEREQHPDRRPPRVPARPRTDRPADPLAEGGDERVVARGVGVPARGRSHRTVTSRTARGWPERRPPRWRHRHRWGRPWASAPPTRSSG
jgi:hypothetical protein